MLAGIFGNNLLNDQSLASILNQLTGVAATKPFECIGTLDEVNAILHHLSKEPEFMDDNLIRHYKNSSAYATYKDQDIYQFLNAFDDHHFLPREFELLLKSSLHD